MAQDQNYLTTAGEAELRRELRQLVENRRPELARKLQDAAAQGDLKENADYHDAKEQLGFIEGRARQIEATLRDAIIVADAAVGDEVRIGSTVLIEEVGLGEEPEEYKVVGVAEANPRAGRISHKSPIGAALLGKKVGARLKVQAPGGQLKLKILEIR